MVVIERDRDFRDPDRDIRYRDDRRAEPRGTVRVSVPVSMAANSCLGMVKLSRTSLGFLGLAGAVTTGAALDTLAATLATGLGGGTALVSAVRLAGAVVAFLAVVLGVAVLAAGCGVVVRGLEPLQQRGQRNRQHATPGTGTGLAVCR